MANDTTRMEKLADDLSAVTIPSCKHMEREEYRDCVMQMLDDLEQLGRRDGCIAAAWALDALPSLLRELAEARLELFLAREGCQLAIDNMHCEDEQDIAMTIHTLQEILNAAPAPSDVKGEEPSASDTNCGGKHIESDTKLTPLTDPSVRGVLVVCKSDDPVDRILLSGLGGVSGWVAVRPASEFGVAGAERIKELEAERAKRTQERDEAVPFVAALKGRHNGYDPGNSKMYPDGPPATPEVALNELIEEQEWLVNSELQQAQSDAERLRKAIEEAVAQWKGGGFTTGEIIAGLQAALSPSPAAASLATSSTWIAGRESAPYTPEPTPAAASGETDADSLYVEAMTDAIKRATSAPAAESQGNAQHHSEGAKIPEGGSGSSAAESEGGEREMLESPDPDSLLEQLMLERNSLAARLSASRARLAACEERCRELEAGIEKHQRQHQAIYEELDGAEKFDRELWSLLAPKAGGEDAVV